MPGDLDFDMRTRTSTGRDKTNGDAMRRCYGLRDKVLLAVGVSLVTAALAGGVLQTSMIEVHASSKDDKAAGAVFFHESGCEHCHGIDGRGTDKAPDLSTIGKRWSKEQIEHQIREGGNSMPAFGDVLQPDQIQALVAFLHAKKKASRARPDTDGQKSLPAAYVPR